MTNRLASSKEFAQFDCVNGIHGAMRVRAGIKHGATTTRRRYAKDEIEHELQMHEIEQIAFDPDDSETPEAQEDTLRALEPGP